MDHVDTTISSAELCDLLALTSARLAVLAKNGVIPKTGRGRYDCREAVRAYCLHMREHAARAGRPPLASTDELKGQKIRLASEQADRIAAQNAAARRELLPVADVERTWSDTLRAVRAGVLSLPARVGQRLGHLTAFDLSEMDHEVRAVLEELSDAR